MVKNITKVMCPSQSSYQEVNDISLLVMLNPLFKMVSARFPIALHTSSPVFYQYIFLS